MTTELAPGQTITYTRSLPVLNSQAPFQAEADGPYQGVIVQVRAITVLVQVGEDGPIYIVLRDDITAGEHTAEARSEHIPTS
jgi:hypothetical protein